MVKAFVERLRDVGITPDEVITDDSRLYPSVLAEVWPTAMHQLCLFHATRRVVRAVSGVVKVVRRALATPPSASKPTLLGRLRETRRLTTSMTQIRNATVGVWHGARWVSPRSMHCTSTHHDVEEVFFVLDAKVTVFWEQDGQRVERTLGPRDAISVPPGIARGERSDGDLEARMLVTNDGELEHTATDQSGAWDTGVLKAGEAVEVTFNATGNFVYFCQPHPWMVAEIIVQ